MKEPFRLLLEPEPRSGAMNMAVDEILLDAAAEGGAGALRFYRWSEATLSLGYFQTAEEAARDPALAALPVVRRLSGGGAILHHHEWTYSCTIPASHPIARSPFQLYDRIHEPIVAWLDEGGVPAAMRRAAPASAKAATADPAARAFEPFLCFGRGDPRDIVLHGFKILGSAQRRRRGAILQHGSLLLRASPFARQFPGLRELADRSELEERLPHALAARIIPTLGEFVEGKLSPEEEALAQGLAPQYSVRDPDRLS